MAICEFMHLKMVTQEEKNTMKERIGLSHPSLILHSFACDNGERENLIFFVYSLRIWMVLVNVMQEKW
jgi:hypothetical protein